MFIVLKKKSVIWSIVAVSLLVILSIGTYFGAAAPVYFGKSTRKVPVYSVDTDKKVVALSFDAAWGADKTQGILDILNKNEISATFFLVGFWIDKYEEETKAIAKAGLDIGNHTRNHLNMTVLSEDEIKKEIDDVNRRIEKLCGVVPKYFRAPFGAYNNKLIESVKGAGLTPVQWSIDTLDWKGITTREIVNRVVPKAKNGDIILFHNNSDNVLNALPLVIEGLKMKGFSFVKMSDLVLTEKYTVDANGVQRAI